MSPSNEEARPDFRAKVIAHKIPRRIALTPNATLYFEDFLTMQYQVQEMLRVERIFEVDGIMEEIEAYNPLSPMAKLESHLHARIWRRGRAQAALGRPWGWKIKSTCAWGRASALRHCRRRPRAGHGRKDPSVHFMRFELSDVDAAAVRSGAPIIFGANHENLTCEVTLTDAQRASLAADLTP